MKRRVIVQPYIKKLVIREALIWCQYFVISSLSAVWAHDFYLSQRLEPPEVGVDALHWEGLFRDLWRGYFLPWFCAFLILSAIRFLALLLIYSFRKSGEGVGTSAASELRKIEEKGKVG